MQWFIGNGWNTTKTRREHTWNLPKKDSIYDKLNKYLVSSNLIDKDIIICLARWKQPIITTCSKFCILALIKSEIKLPIREINLIMKEEEHSQLLSVKNWVKSK